MTIYHRQSIHRSPRSKSKLYYWIRPINRFFLQNSLIVPIYVYFTYGYVRSVTKKLTVVKRKFIQATTTLSRIQGPLLIIQLLYIVYL